MTQPAPEATHSADHLRYARETADAWYAKARYLTQAADNLLEAAGLIPQPAAAATLPAGVASLADRRRLRGA